LTNALNTLYTNLSRSSFTQTEVNMTTKKEAGANHPERYSNYQGWSEIEIKYLLPTASQRLISLVCENHIHPYAIGPGNDPVNEILLDLAKILPECTTTAIDRDKKQLSLAGTLGFDQLILGNLLQTKSPFIPSTFHRADIVTAIMVLHNLPTGSLHDAIANIASICRRGTIVYCIDPIMDAFITPETSEERKIKLGTFAQVVDKMTRQIVRGRNIMTFPNDCEVEMVPDYHNPEKCTTISCGYHPLHEYLDAFRKHEFATHHVLIEKEGEEEMVPAWQIITAIKL